MWRDSFIYVTWLTYIRIQPRELKSPHHPSLGETIIGVMSLHRCDVTRSYVWHESIYMRDMMHSYVWHNSLIYMHHLANWRSINIHLSKKQLWESWVFIHVTWLICMCDTTHLYMWYDSFICATWLIHMCDMTHLYMYTASRIEEPTPSISPRNNHRSHESSFMWRDSFVCVTRLIPVRDMTHSYVWHDLLSHVHCLANWRSSIQYPRHCESACCSVLQCVAVCCSVLRYVSEWHHTYAISIATSPGINYGSHESSCMRRDSFVCVTQLIHMRDMTHSYMRHDSTIYVHSLANWRAHTIHLSQKQS